MMTTSREVKPAPIEQLQDSDWEQPDEDEDEEQQPPYSVRNEIHFFFSQGVPLGLATVLELGAPPLFAMLIAGHTQNSADLQAALGYGRVYFNITMLMPMNGILQYLWTVVPGCIGAKRHDRIASYFQRSVLRA